jgi:LacI family transcriptional regulator
MCAKKTDQPQVPVTASKLAEHLGLSKATVTHVLNGHGAELRIKPETQKRVLQAAKELGYRPNVSARTMRTGRFGCAAFIQSLKSTYLPSDLMLGVLDALKEYDMHLIMAEAPDEILDEQNYLPKVVRELAADGLLINRIVDIPQHFIERVHDLHIPAIFLNIKGEFDSVYPDDLTGGKIATEYLLQLGHRKIVYVQSLVNLQPHYSIQDRRRGYEDTMRKAGFQPQVWTLPADPFTMEEILADKRLSWAYEYLKTERDRPTAVIAYELTEALAIFYAAAALQIKIPEMLSLVTFHWGIDSSLCIPFTTMSNSIGNVGRTSVSMLMEKLKNPTSLLPSRSVPLSFLEGGTSAKPGGI